MQPRRPYFCGELNLRLQMVMSNIYLELTNRFNEGKLRAVLSSGQAVVMHRMALASKDGDWIIREEAESLNTILSVLESYGATYRLGAPLDARWLSGGWSSHFEFGLDGYRAHRFRDASASCIETVSGADVGRTSTSLRISRAHD